MVITLRIPRIFLFRFLASAGYDLELKVYTFHPSLRLTVFPFVSNAWAVTVVHTVVSNNIDRITHPSKIMVTSKHSVRCLKVKVTLILKVNRENIWVCFHVRAIYLLYL